MRQMTSGRCMTLKCQSGGTHLKGTQYEANNRWDMFDSEIPIWGTHYKGLDLLLIGMWKMYDSDMPIWGTHIKGTQYAAD